jgi:ParB family chromosome partitioning protein
MDATIGPQTRSNIEQRALDSLHQNPDNGWIYDDRTDLDDAFLQSIEENGIRVPLIVTPENLLVSGHRRWEAAKRVDLESVPVIVREYDDEHDRKEALIDLNRQREKTFSQKMREADAIHEIESTHALERQGQRTDLRENSPECKSDGSEFRRTRDVVAEKTNIGSGKTYDQARTVWEAAKSGNQIAIREVERLDADDQSIYGAYKKVRSSRSSESKEAESSSSAATPTDVAEDSPEETEGYLTPDDLILSAHTGTNAEVFPKVLDLHVEEGAQIADVTFGQGNFWPSIDLDAYQLVATDIRPERSPNSESGVDYRQLPYEDGELDALVFDPPYANGLFNGDRQSGDGNSWIEKQYGTTDTEGTGHDAVLDEYDAGSREAKRVLRDGGTFIVKTMDQVSGGDQHLTHVDVIQLCEELGFTTLDLFVVVRPKRPNSPGVTTQHHARKNHSYFLVFNA